ncbi:unnamed protein product [Didymodactylos carnosus]|uniref:Uncharacterized protein n=1 Tax=Didymodactylos carnosus TaxID=1234261 RepID=A0A8S2R9C4_9BILA|nr:unnamed protein product [Didymodactylos carnosus]CAF4149113.1 unnamed protein product [Didymodactylos carnosus]
MVYNRVTKKKAQLSSLKSQKCNHSSISAKTETRQQLILIWKWLGVSVPSIISKKNLQDIIRLNLSEISRTARISSSSTTSDDPRSHMTSAQSDDTWPLFKNAVRLPADRSTVLPTARTTSRITSDDDDDDFGLPPKTELLVRFVSI